MLFIFKILNGNINCLKILKEIGWLVPIFYFKFKITVFTLKYN